MDKLIVLVQAKHNLGIPELEKEFDSIMDEINSGSKGGLKTFIEFLKIQMRLRHLWKKELPKELKRMGYDPKEILK